MFGLRAKKIKNAIWKNIKLSNVDNKIYQSVIFPLKK